jgi:NADP-dependent 3-hydroxy acid dehydrogenase YdfG
VSGKAYTTVLISGSNSGFGLETARKLASQGYRVFGTMRDERRNAGARTNLSVPTSPSSISTSPIRTRWIAAWPSSSSSLDVRINNAGATHLGIKLGTDHQLARFRHGRVTVEVFHRCVVPALADQPSVSVSPETTERT